MGLCGGHTDEERREPALELVQERFCHDYCIDSVAKNGSQKWYTYFASTMRVTLC